MAQGDGHKDEKAKRLTEALRENLRRRKAQARQVRASEGESPDKTER